MWEIKTINNMSKEIEKQNRINELKIEIIELKEAHQREMEELVGEILEESCYDEDGEKIVGVSDIKEITQKHNINIGDEMDTLM